MKIIKTKNFVMRNPTPAPLAMLMASSAALAQWARPPAFATRLAGPEIWH
jgi:hypothetical protein